MKRFKNILVVLDWHEENSLLIDRGLNLAAQNGSIVNFVLVFEPAFKNQKSDSSLDKRMKAHYELGIRKCVELLEESLRAKKSPSVESRISALLGTPDSEIICKVVDENIDLVILGIVEDEKDTGPVLSGLPLRLMRKCPCAVWAMRPTPLEGFNRIVAAVDTRDQFDEARALNTKIMELAVSIAKSEKSELHVLHAWSLEGEEVLRGSIDDTHLNDWITREKQQSHRLLSEFLEPFKKEIVDVHFHKGPADVLLPLFISHYKPDLLVMGTVNRIGIAGFLFGNTAERILQKVDCSVLTVKPDGWKS